MKGYIICHNKIMINFRELHFKLNPMSKGYMFRSYDRYHLDCLLDPDKHMAALRSENSGRRPCYTVEEFEGKEQVFLCNPPKEGSVEAASLAKVNESRDSVAALKKIRESGTFTYALVAPAFLGQFSGKASPGRLRSALKALGFDGMIEVALFADILTLKEAIEFDRNIVDESDFLITSCCCPMWVAMIKKLYSKLMSHMPPSVSPMIASGRLIKKLYPDAVTVFIGPCVAKKAEAREPDLAGAVDIVLTFSEVQSILSALGIDAASFPASDKEHSSYSGRVYAKAGGVSDAVSRTLKRINPDRKIMPVSKCADGVPACRAMVDSLEKKQIEANFFEGMGCSGGCVGGPKTCIDVSAGKKNVEGYAESAKYLTPIDNPYILELLHRIGIDTDEDLLKSELFNRKF